MITGPIAKLLVQHVAAPLFQQFISGRLQLFGSSLRDPGSGKVIGYLQARDTIGAASDTAKVIGALPFLANPVTAPFAAAYSVGKTGFAIFDTQRTAHRIA